jgi:hypothetical protein
MRRALKNRLALVLTAAMVWALLYLIVAILTPRSTTEDLTAQTTPAQDDPVLVGAGDIAGCSTAGDEATANLLDGIPGTVFTLGDNVYDSGTDAEFANCYEPSWGRHEARTKPSVGNHEYLTAGASGYFNYFGPTAGEPGKGYYSYDLGGWHMIVLNSNCSKVTCAAGSPQEQWLRADLAAHPNSCTLAYFHHPLYSSGEHGNQTQVRPFWRALYEANADAVLSGHDHTYERFAPQDPFGVADPRRGIREFVVGTGGKNHYAFTTVQPNSEVRNATTHGVLKLTLHPTGYDWQFVPVAGQTFTDSGSATCHSASASPDTTAPTVTGVTPADTTTGVPPSANAEASFSEAMDASTINDVTFTLTKPDPLQQLGGTPVVATLSYEPTTNTAILDPNAELEAEVTYTATLKGGPSGVKDRAGNPLEADKVWSFTTAVAGADTTAPETTLDDGPSGSVNSASASISFSSSEQDSTFECSLDGGAFQGCTSPQQYAGLADGSHTFNVKATDAAGNADTTPASSTWTIDTTAPVTQPPVQSLAASSCTGKYVYPGANLVNVAAAAPSGTTFCIHQGTYYVPQPVKVQSGDRFVGVYSSFPRPTIKSSIAQQVLNAGGSTGAIIQGLRVEGAVGDQSCQPECGRGISGGTKLTVDDVRLTNNKNQGIGGAGSGLLVKNSEIDHNGSAPFAQQTGRETAAGIKSVNPMTVQNSYIHDNYWAGVWCDENCGTLRVENNTIVGNGQRGVHTEISIGPQVISGNTIQGNGHFESWSLEAGVLISSVRDVEVYNNTFGGNLDHGVQVVDDGRWPVTGDVSVYGNAMNGDPLNGCLILAVSCPGNY